MIAGYIALTEMTAEKDLIVYYGNIQCPEMMFSGRFKLHLLPSDITYVTLINRDFVTGERETEAIVGLDEALKSGFMQPVELLGKNLNLSEIKSPIPRSIRPVKKRKKPIDKV